MVSDEVIIQKIHEINSPLRRPYCSRDELRESLTRSGREISDKDLNKQLRRLENERKVVCCTCGECSGNISIKRIHGNNGGEFNQLPVGKSQPKKYF